MEFLFLIFIFLLALCIFKFLLNLTLENHNKNKTKKLPPPPGPSPTLFLLKNVLNFLLQYQKNACFNVETILQNQKKKHGPIFHLRILSRSDIVICSHSLAHKALVEKGAVFSNRPTGLKNRPNANEIISTSNGPTWHILRRNLSSQMFTSSRMINSYSHTRIKVVGHLMEQLLSQISDEPINLMEHFRFCVFSLLVIMCFGDHNLSLERIKEMETLQLFLLVRHTWLNVFDFWRGLRKILFSKQLDEFHRARKDQESMFLPLIRARRKAKIDGGKNADEPVSYVDTLFDLQLPGVKRALNDREIVSLCGEFLNAGTDTVSTALEWIMANLVKYPEIQERLYEEIVRVVGEPQIGKPSNSQMLDFGVVKERDLEKMVYLKAIVLEGLRRHPPGHFVLPHSVSEDVELENYTIPKNSKVNFMLAEMSWDPMVWENPMEFKPERFLSTSFAAQEDLDGPHMLDIKGNKEMKMMPFGAGRRMCPGSKFALLHLEYFVANMVWYFKWKAIDGIGVDLSENHQFTVVMKNPLRAHIFPRVKSV